LPTPIVSARTVASRAAVAARIPRTVTAHVAIAVAVSSIAVSVAICTAAIAIMTRVAVLRSVALGLGGCRRCSRAFASRAVTK
jgi:hypothetical protein